MTPDAFALESDVMIHRSARTTIADKPVRLRPVRPRATYRVIEGQLRSARKRNAALEEKLRRRTSLSAEKELGQAEARIAVLEYELARARGALYREAEERIGVLERELAKARGALCSADAVGDRLQAVAERLELAAIGEGTGGSRKGAKDAKIGKLNAAEV